LTTAFVIDDISAVGEEPTLLEEAFHDQFGQTGVTLLKGAKIMVGAANAAKGSVDISVALTNGKTYEAVYDAINKTFTSISLMTTTDDYDFENETKKEGN